MRGILEQIQVNVPFTMLHKKYLSGFIKKGECFNKLPNIVERCGPHYIIGRYYTREYDKVFTDQSDDVFNPARHIWALIV